MKNCHVFVLLLFTFALGMGTSVADSVFAVSVTPTLFQPNFGTVDLATGAYTVIATYTKPFNLGIDATPAGQLYAYNDKNQLVQINPVTGATTLIGTGSIPGFGFGTFFTPGGLTTGAFYAINFNGDLYSINLTTGATTLIGNTGINLEAADLSFVCESTGMAGSSDTLFYAAIVPVGPSCTSTNNLYRINPATAAATLIGPTTGASPLGGAAYSNGVLYGFTADPQQIVRLDTSTGAATFVANTSEVIFGGAAPVPEPSIVLLLGSALVGVIGVIRHKAVKPRC
jgi:hypothetical protein